MDAQSFFTTDRLIIKPLAISDDNFILELVNTEGWITFIGNRNITSRAEARVYVQKTIEDTSKAYWVAILRKNGEKIGIVTLIKRDYLEHQDIGFALLPDFGKKGYAFEATCAVLNQLIQEHKFSHILAITVPYNISSVKLLKRIGFDFEKEIQVENEKVHVYGASANKLTP